MTYRSFQLLTIQSPDWNEPTLVSVRIGRSVLGGRLGRNTDTLLFHIGIMITFGYYIN